MPKNNIQPASNTETTSQQLFSHLFEACNILRGPINQDEYKSYVTPILFFKCISDVYDEETQIALEESDGDEEYAAFPENHSFVIPEGCHWNDVREAHENIGVAIVNGQAANIRPFWIGSGVFRDMLLKLGAGIFYTCDSNCIEDVQNE